MASTILKNESIKVEDTSVASDSQPELAEFDWVTNMPFLHLNFIFRKFLWRDYPNLPEVQHSWKNIRSSIETASEKFPNFGVLFNGEYGSETCVPPNFFIPRPTASPARIQHGGKNNILVRNNAGRIVPDDGKVKVKCDVATPGYVRLEVITADGARKVINNSHLADVSSEMGKMAEMINKASSEENTESSCSLCVPVEKWPEDFERWRERAKIRNWPEADIIDALVTEGCYVTPREKPGQLFGAGDAEPVTWRYCFPSQDTVLQALMNDTMRRILALFYILLDDDLLLPSVLTKEHVRMELYATVQKLGEDRFVEDNIGWCFLALVDTVFHDLIQSRIPNFFFPSYNMIEGVDEDFICNARKIISHLRRAPLDLLFKFESAKRLSCMPVETTIKEISTPLLTVKGDIKMTKVVPAMYESLKCELAERLRVDEYEAAKFSAEEFAFALGKTFVEETTAEEIILVAAYELKDIDQVVRITERVVEDTVDSKRRLLYLPNLGCLYYGQACRMANGKEKERVLMKMETTFRECLSSMECKSSSVVEYCNIMCSQKRYSEALPLLEKLMDNYMSAPNAFLEYDGHEIYALDDNLKAYIEHGQKVRVDLLAYAYYLLARCYQEVDPARLDEGFWNRFSAVCIAAENGRDLPSKLTFTLLGLALHTFGENEGAEDAFLQALEINHDDIVAKSFSPTAVQDLGMIDGQEAYVCPTRILMNSMNASSTEYSDLEKFGFDFDFTGLYE